MADKKISELTAATTVNDDDQLPLVQSGSTLSLDASVLRAYITADSTLVKVDANQLLSVANSITERGHYSKGAFNGTYTDGIVLDYVTGKGRISVGSSDGLSIYNGGVGGTALLNLTAAGRLGLGTASPSIALDVVGGINSTLTSTLAKTNTESLVVGDQTAAGAKLDIQTASGTAASLRLYQQGVSNFTIAVPASTDGLAFSSYLGEKMRLTSAGYLGIGTSSPGGVLDIQGAGGGVALQIKRSSSDIFTVYQGSGVTWLDAASSGGQFAFASNGTALMRLDSSGNLGLGVTPSGWSGFKALQINNGGFASYLNGANTQTAVLCNAYFDGGSYRFIASTQATYYNQDNGVHKWFNSNNTSGTAGAAWTPTQAMTLDASGRLGIGVTSPTYALEVARSGADPYVRIGTGNGSDCGLLLYATQNLIALRSDTSGALYISSGSSASMMFNTNGSERARIDSSGNLLVGITATTGYQDGKLSVQGSGTNPAFTAKLDPSGTNNTQFVCSAWAPFTAGNNVFVSFETETTATVRGTISYNRGAGLVAYNTSSDQRLKTNIAPAGSAAQSILDFPVDQFDWIDSGNHVDFGAIAQKAINVIPEMVSVPADEDEMWGIDWSKAVPRLIRTAQEQHEMILALREELEQVKATLH